MAATVVEAVKFVTNSGTGGTVNNMITYAAASLAVAGAADFSSGSGAAANMTISDNVNGSYSISGRLSSNDHAGCVGLFYKENVSAGSVNVTWAVNSGGISLFVQEVTGAETTSAHITSATVTSTASSTTTWDTGDISNTGTANATYFAIMSNTLAGNPVTLNINQSGTEGTWTKFSTAAEELNGNDNMVGQLLSQEVTSVSARGHVWGGSSAQASTVIAVFKSGGPVAITGTGAMTIAAPAMAVEAAQELPPDTILGQRVGGLQVVTV